MINVAIVGTGNIANAHVTGLLTFPERCKIVALCDIYPEKAKAMKEKYALDSGTYTIPAEVTVNKGDVGISGLYQIQVTIREGGEEPPPPEEEAGPEDVEAAAPAGEDAQTGGTP